MHIEGKTKCQSFGTHTGTHCKPLEIYCKLHSGIHYIDTNHEIIPIEKVNFKIFKHQIKSCINHIAKNTSSVIDQLRRTSLKAITQLKQTNKNIKNIDELNLHFYDPERISFLVEQASYINLKMNDNGIQMEKQASQQRIYSNQQALPQLNSLTLQVPPQHNSSTIRIPPQHNLLTLQESSKPNPSASQGTNEKGFNGMTLLKKIEFKDKIWSFVPTYDNSREVMLSNNNKYLFFCKFRLGNFEADWGNLNVS